MDGTKLARRRTCHECPHRATRHASVWPWPRCTYGGGEGVELTDEFLEGPATNCPLGKWHELAPVDVEAEARAAEEAGRRRLRQALKPLVVGALAALRAGLSRPAYLVREVRSGRLPRWLAEELAAEDGLDLDAAAEGVERVTDEGRA